MSVPNRHHIAWQNDFAAVTIAASETAETAYPLTNMQNQNANEPTVIDMTGETTVAITDVDSPDSFKSATCWALHNHNFPDGTTARLRLYDAINQGGSVVYDSTALDVMNNVPIGSIIAGVDPIEGNFEDFSRLKTHFSRFFETVEWKSFQIDITNAGGFTDDLLQVDKVWIAFAFCPQKNPNVGLTSTLLDDSEHFKKPGGGMETVSGDVRRSMSLDYSNIVSAQRHTIRYILDKATMGGDLLISIDPNDALSYRYEMTSIYRRTNDMSFITFYLDGNGFSLTVEEN